MSIHFLPTKAPRAGESAAVLEAWTAPGAQTTPRRRPQFWPLDFTPEPAAGAPFRHRGIAYQVLMVGMGPVLTWKIAVEVRNWSEQRVWQALCRTRRERPDLPQVDARVHDETLTLETVDPGQHDELEVHALAHAFAERLRAT